MRTAANLCQGFCRHIGSKGAGKAAEPREKVCSIMSAGGGTQPRQSDRHHDYKIQRVDKIPGKIPGKIPDCIL
jgi:hypothetical protein